MKILKKLNLSILFLLIMVFFAIIFFVSMRTTDFVILNNSFQIPSCDFFRNINWKTYFLFGILFLAPFWNLKSFWSLRNLDLLMVLLWIPFSIACKSPFAVMLIYVPLIYFITRMIYDVRIKSLEKLNLNFSEKLLKILIIIIFCYSISEIITGRGDDSSFFMTLGSIVLKEKGYYPYTINVTFDDVQGQVFYGPLSYLIYLPFTLVFNYHGLPPSKDAHFTSPANGIIDASKIAGIFFYIITTLGLKLLGDRIGGKRFGTSILYFWIVNPFIHYNLQNFSSDFIPFAFIVWGLYTISFPIISGVFLSFSILVKYFSAPLSILWLSVFNDKKKFIFFITLFIVNFLFLLSIIYLNGFEGIIRIYRYLSHPSGWSVWTFNQNLMSLREKLMFLTPILFVYISCYFHKRKEKDIYALISLSALFIMIVLLLKPHIFYFYLLWVFGLIPIVILREDKFIMNKSIKVKS